MIHYINNHPEMGNMLWLEEGDVQIGIALDYGIRVRHLSIKGMENLYLRVTLSGKNAVFSVEDDGCGISEDRMERLFTGMLDSKAPVDSGRSNMGIGLSVCRTIIKAHGSELKAGTRPEGGAVFSFTLETEETGDAQ